MKIIKMILRWPHLNLILMLCLIGMTLQMTQVKGSTNSDLSLEKFSNNSLLQDSSRTTLDEKIAKLRIWFPAFFNKFFNSIRNRKNEKSKVQSREVNLRPSTSVDDQPKEVDFPTNLVTDEYPVVSRIINIPASYEPHRKPYDPFKNYDDVFNEIEEDNRFKKTGIYNKKKQKRKRFRTGCGVRHIQGPKRVRRVVGGRISGPGNWPWMALVENSDQNPGIKVFCGGALISDKHVITAAHCLLRNASYVTVKLGSIEKYDNHLEHYSKRLKVIAVAKHYRFDEEHYNYDVALLELEERVKFNPHIQPICLPGLGVNFEGWQAYVTGWGKPSEESKRGVASLREVDVELISPEMCTAYYREVNREVTVQKDQICAGYKEGRKDACTGDSGGPLMLQVRGRWVLAGLVSYGFGCAIENQPGIYVNVAHMVRWIINTIYTNGNRDSLQYVEEIGFNRG